MLRTLLLKTLSRSVVFFLLYASKLIPLKWGYALSGALGVTAYSVLPRYRRVALDNLRIALGEEKPDAELKTICRCMYVNLIKNIYEFLLFPRLSRNEIKSMTTLDGEILRKYTAAGNGLVILTAHLGNWELLGARIVAEGFNLTVIGKDQRDKMINRLLLYLRTSTGVKNVPKGKGVFTPIMEALRGNEIVGLLADQNAGPDGLFVDFFGTPASTFTGPAVFASKTGAPILPAFCIRQSDNSHEVVFFEPILTTRGANEELVEKYTQQYTKCIENIVEKYPEQWLWLHKRWKTRPEISIPAQDSAESGKEAP